MDIEVALRVNESALVEKSENSKRLATGWVELEGCLKFPVTVRSYEDKDTKEEKMFVSYPQRKSTTSSNGYTSIIQLRDKELKEQIDNAVLDKMRSIIVKPIKHMEIEKVNVTAFHDKGEDKLVKLRGAASVNLKIGITIHGILIKEGKKGLFIEMPQYMYNGEYHDTVYSSTNSMRSNLKDAVLEAYEKKLQQKMDIAKEELKPQPEADKTMAPPEEEVKAVSQEQEDMTTVQKKKMSDMIQQILDSMPVSGLRDILTEESPRLNDAEYTNDGSMLAYQEAVMSRDNIQVTMQLRNPYEPGSMGTERITQDIVAAVYQEKTYKGMATLVKYDAMSPTAAEANYQKLIADWKGLTKQEIPIIELPKDLRNSKAAEEFLAAYEKQDKEAMIAALEKAAPVIAVNQSMANGNGVLLQAFSLNHEEDMISVRFYNSYDKRQVTEPTKPVTQRIEAAIYKDGTCQKIVTLDETKSKSIKGAAKNYDKMLDKWKHLTHQEKIQIGEYKESKSERVGKDAIRQPQL